MKNIVAVALSAIGLATLLSSPVSAQEMSQEELLKRGQRVFLMCRSCHTLEADGRHKVGPNLHGMFGSHAGAKEDFRYSDAVKNSEIVWSEETLTEWLVKPKDFLPGNKMAFAGVRRETDRQALIAYLKQETGAKE